MLTESDGHKQADVLAALAPSSGSYLLCKFIMVVLISVVTVSLAVMFWHSEERHFHFEQRKIHWQEEVSNPPSSSSQPSSHLP